MQSTDNIRRSVNIFFNWINLTGGNARFMFVKFDTMVHKIFLLNSKVTIWTKYTHLNSRTSAERERERNYEAENFQYFIFWFFLIAGYLIILCPVIRSVMIRSFYSFSFHSPLYMDKFWNLYHWFWIFEKCWNVAAFVRKNNRNSSDT